MPTEAATSNAKKGQAIRQPEILWLVLVGQGIVGHRHGGPRCLGRLDTAPVSYTVVPLSAIPVAVERMRERERALAGVGTYSRSWSENMVSVMLVNSVSRPGWVDSSVRNCDSPSQWFPNTNARGGA